MKKVFRVIFLLMILGGCSVEKQLEAGAPKKDFDGESLKEEYETDFYGVWHIDQTVLRSKMHIGTVEDGDFEENVYDPADYIDMKLEYNPEYFCLGDKKYANPEYVLTNTTVKDVNESGKFYSPDIYEFISASNESKSCLEPARLVLTFDDCREGQIPPQLAVGYLTADEQIEVFNGNNNSNLAETPLLQLEVRFDKEISYGKFDFIPVGTQCILLNENTMLVGLWGKVLLAHKVSEDTG